MKQFEEALNGQQETAQKLMDNQKQLAEEFNSQHLALGQKFAQKVQDAVQKSPFEWQDIVGAYTDYQKQVLEVNTKTFQKGFQSWANLASAFTPK